MLSGAIAMAADSLLVFQRVPLALALQLMRLTISGAALSHDLAVVPVFIRALSAVQSRHFRASVPRGHLGEIP